MKAQGVLEQRWLAITTAIITVVSFIPVTPAVALDIGIDFDEDGFVGSADNCPFKYNPLQMDTDGDGDGDACDIADGAENTPALCANGTDNDEDGLIDMADPDCAGLGGGGGSLFACSDGVDNDGDGLIDLADPGCLNSADTDETNAPSPTPAACADGVDNDGDGLVDLADPGCSGASDTDESNTTGGSGGGGGGGSASGGSGSGGGGSGAVTVACNDGIDNDGDGLIDYPADAGCASASDQEELGGVQGASTVTPTPAPAPSPAPTGQVEGATCELYLTEPYIKRGAGSGLFGSIVKLQQFLNTHEGETLTVNGTYNAATIAAVKRFQQKYAAQILTPWGISAPTGWTYITTTNMINQLVDPDCAPPLPALIPFSS